MCVAVRGIILIPFVILQISDHVLDPHDSTTSDYDPVWLAGTVRVMAQGDFSEATWGKREARAWTPPRLPIRSGGERQR
jgi:hypothetical protein